MLIPLISNSYWPITFVILLIFSIFRITSPNKQNRLAKSELIFWIALFLYFWGRAFIYSMESIINSNFDSYIFINWCLAPCLFSIIIYNIRKNRTTHLAGETLYYSLSCLLVTTIIIMILEMVTRGQNFGINFLLHGANGGYSNTDADVTGGHGEPLVLGMSAAFGSIFALQKSKYKLLFFMILLTIFSMSLRPMLIAIIIIITLTFSSTSKKNALPAISAMTVSLIIALTYKDVLLAKFMGVDSASATLNYGGGVTVGYNIVFYFENLQWANYVDLDIDPWIQILTAFLVGGNEGIPFFDKGYVLLPFIIGITKTVLATFLLYNTYKNRNYKALPALFIFFLLICYLDPFQSVYKSKLDVIRLGSTPRESPSYFFILYTCATYYLLGTKSPLPEKSSLKQLALAVLNK
ncbi:hypothetical protein [Pseudomonas sp.]|uniref:hypothetical protein n=1 Tax=Pseudomonas sp. TaxID=306 RepID=UPI0025FFE4F8|nr:hypothetical protein [Pseudomonas sp.]